MPVRTEKNRYIAFNVRASEAISKGELKESLRKKFHSYLQITNFKIISYNRSKNILIIRCGHKHVESIKKTLNELEINGLHLQSKVIMISGTLNTLRRKLGFLIS